MSYLSEEELVELYQQQVAQLDQDGYPKRGYLLINIGNHYLDMGRKMDALTSFKGEYSAFSHDSTLVAVCKAVSRVVYCGKCLVFRGRGGQRCRIPAT